MSRAGRIECLLAFLGMLLIGTALAADADWWDRHFLPIFRVPASTLSLLEQIARALLLLAGVIVILVVRRPLARRLGAHRAGTLAAASARVIVAVVLALVAGEMILRLHPPHPHDADPLALEPRRESDGWLGWVFVPDRTVETLEAGRPVSYSFDKDGRRIAAPGRAVDERQPAILLTGESILAGFGLSWQQSIAGRLEAITGIPVADLAVSDYSNGQAWLRLAGELRRFHAPVAVIGLFMPALLDRNLLPNRPHLSRDLHWLPPDPQWRLTALAHFVFPYRSEAAVAQGIATTQASLRALVEAAQARGAPGLILVPQFGPESPAEHRIRTAVLDAANLPYVLVPLDPLWRLPGDGHPDARAAAAIAAAVDAWLRAWQRRQPAVAAHR
jgi:hypothetical protein